MVGDAFSELMSLSRLPIVSSCSLWNQKHIGRILVQDSASRINSIDFHRTHDLLVTGGDDDAIRLYNTESGTAQQALLSKKYGVKSVCFTHDPSSVIYSSNKVGGERGWCLAA